MPQDNPTLTGDSCKGVDAKILFAEISPSAIASLLPSRSTNCLPTLSTNWRQKA